MKQACRANKSGEVFYIEREDGIEVTLRNPMTGVVKTVRGTTLKRSYTLLTTEELKAMNTTTEEKTINPIDYKELLDCESKADFEAKVEGVASTTFEDIAAIEDIDTAKKARGNAVLCFRENMVRYLNAKPELDQAKAAIVGHEDDLDLKKSLSVVENAMQKYTNKMVMYYGKAIAAQAKIAELTPAAPVEAPAAE